MSEIIDSFGELNVDTLLRLRLQFIPFLTINQIIRGAIKNLKSWITPDLLVISLLKYEDQRWLMVTCLSDNSYDSQPLLKILLTCQPDLAGSYVRVCFMRFATPFCSVTMTCLASV